MSVKISPITCLPVMCLCVHTHLFTPELSKLCVAYGMMVCRQLDLKQYLTLVQGRPTCGPSRIEWPAEYF